MSVLKTERLTYLYEDDTIALEDINVDFSKGKRIGIIGENGSGKSTLFLNLIGILRPKKGKVIFNEKPIKYNKRFLREYRKRVNIVFQDPDKQIFYSNVYDDVAFALRNLGYEEEEVSIKVENALAKVGATEFKKKPVHFLSYGQKKRIAIASILAMDGEIVLFDEPTSGLDPFMTKEMVKILKNISKEKTIVISSHDMDLIYEICDYVYVLNKGKIIKDGLVEEVFCQEKIIKKAGLNQPWLVKLHKNLGIPLFRNEEEFYKYWRDKNGFSINRS